MINTTHEVIAHTFQQEASRVIAVLLNTLHDLELAEDCLQDAFVIAMEHWSRDGIPHNPGAWLTTAARHKAIDRLRRDRTLQRKKAVLKALLDIQREEEETMYTDEIPDDRLKLIFTCCHPALAQEAQVALTLQVLGGLTTPEIAAAFLVPVPTMAQRLVRAKRKIRDAGIPYQVPPVAMISERLEVVLSVLYLIFNAGYIAPVGNTLIRHDLCEEAIRLTRILNSLLASTLTLTPDAEALGLLALMLLHHSRRKARIDASGALVLLEDQDRTLWDQNAIVEALAILEQALAMHNPGVYQIQAAISALHAQAKHPDETDWNQITALYSVLYKMNPSPVVALNHAVATAMAQGFDKGLRLLDELEDTGVLSEYYLFHAARADLLRRTGWLDDAYAAYKKALELCQNDTEQTFLRRRLIEVEIALRL